MRIRHQPECCLTLLVRVNPSRRNHRGGVGGCGWPALGAPVARSRPHTAQNRPPPRPARRKRGNTTPESHSVPVPSLASLSHLRIHMAHGGGSEDAHATQSCVLAATIPYRQSARPLAPDMRLISANIKLDILTYTNSPVYFPQSARQVFQSGDRSLSPWGQESPSTVIRGAGGGAVHMGDAGRPSLPYHGENEGRRSTYRNRIPHEAISSQHASTRINTHQHASLAPPTVRDHPRATSRASPTREVVSRPTRTARSTLQELVVKHTPFRQRHQRGMETPAHEKTPSLRARRHLLL